MYKLIACDLDETLLNSENKVSQKNIEAIKKADAQGVKFVLATGRGYATVQGTLEEIGLKDKKDEYVISFNGGAVTENKDNQLLHFQGISFDFASELYKRGQDYDVAIHVYTQEEVYVYNLVEKERKHLKTKMDVIEITDKNLDFLKGQPIAKVLYMNTDREYLNQIEEDLKDITQNSNVTYSSNRYIEFNDKGVNKGAGITFLADHLGLDISQTIAIGDNFNDLAMLETAGLSIGVQNMVPELKEKMDYVTEANHNESAIAEVIEKFILNRED
ncbi:MAG TPA: Cof-type HAD-IIB family hydrolase [Candidatus Atopostipes pullistercoris]|uniref:Cof-type HAD-IIB family hydrolase n=1 Tax=Candidatus Atopostipes pullistercoris TaxID=2838467 RepID=A0A9D2G179_9LACT|nr:Cof-type HAD-IIB family hydrolase [Candidatus Atopostipes pullistercoris]